MTIQTEVDSPSESQSIIPDANLFSVIRNRRATRGYLSKPVSEDVIRSLIDLSIKAPSAMNLQPWSFIVIQNQKLLKEISDEVKKRLFSNPDFLKESGKHRLHFISEPDFNIFYNASTLIVICAREKGEKGFSAEADCFLAGQNLMLAATGMGLATCPIGLARDLLREPQMSKRLGIPSDCTPVLPIVVGYASSSTPPVDRNPPIVKWIQ